MEDDIQVKTKFETKSECDKFIEKLNALDEEIISASFEDIMTGDVGKKTLLPLIGIVGYKMKKSPDFQLPVDLYVAEALNEISNRKDPIFAFLFNLIFSNENEAVLGTPVAAIRKKVKKRSRWIIRQQTYFTDFLPLMPKKEYVSGKSFRYLGRQYRLKVIETNETHIKISDKRLMVGLNDKHDTAQIQMLVEHWYQAEAMPYFSNRLEKLWPQFSEGNQPSPTLLVRKMPKRWDSYTRSGKIILNVELIQAPSHCIDYVIAHELCHVFYRDHSPKFFELLEKIMPDWKLRKNSLEKI